jgi:hypothetical protein
MYILLFIVALLVILFVFQSNVESFTNTNKCDNLDNNIKKMSKVRKVGIQYENEIPHFSSKIPGVYRSQFDSTQCTPCENPPSCSEHNSKCINENTYYNTLDNCVEDGTCRLGEDVVNLFPTNNSGSK